MTKTEIELLRRLEREANEFGLVVIGQYVALGDDLAEDVFATGSVVFSARASDEILAFYVGTFEKPFHVEPIKVFENLDDVIVEAKDYRFRFMPVTESWERKARELFKEQASVSSMQLEYRIIFGESE